VRSILGHRWPPGTAVPVGASATVAINAKGELVLAADVRDSTKGLRGLTVDQLARLVVSDPRKIQLLEQIALATGETSSLLDQILGGANRNASGGSASAPQAAGQGRWTPAMIPGAVGWWRADLGVTTGSTFTWADQSGAGNNLSQATGGLQPSFTASDPNFGGNPSISGFVHATGTTLASGTVSPAIASGTFFQVAHIATVTTSSLFFGNNSQPQFFINTSDNFAMYAGAEVDSGTTVTVSTFVWACAWSTTGTLNSSAWVNSSASPIFTNQTAAGSSSLNRFQLGAAGSASTGITGAIAESAVYNVELTTSQIAQLFAYAGSRYGQAWS
jgi:hypothetical protein